MPFMARAMLNCAQDIIKNSDIIVPTPLHWHRLFKRRYNQSSLLAKYIYENSDLLFQPELLGRVKATTSQGRKTRAQRIKNVKGAFEVPNHGRKHLKGKSILLIDDVFTTGATVTECTTVLKKAGIESVNVLTFARVIKPLS